MKNNFVNNPYPAGEFFTMPHKIFTLRLSMGEIAVYAYLRSCEDDTHRCWPSYKTIGRVLRVSKNTVRKYVGTLCEKGLISVESTSVKIKNGIWQNGNLRYTIEPIANAVNTFWEGEFARSERANERHRVQAILAERNREEEDADRKSAV